MHVRDLFRPSPPAPMTGYFDHNATTPMSPAAREAWIAAQADHWQNPSGLYCAAGAVKRRLEETREAFGEILGCEPRRIVFNSGATEGCNAAMAREARTGARVFISAIEHPAVVAAARKFFGAAAVTEMPVDATGVLDLERARQMIADDPPTLVALMAANNETGVLQPWRELAAACRENGVRYFCDAAQWIGKLSTGGLHVCDWVTMSAHKFGGPKGCGLLVIPDDIDEPLSLQAGGPQEGGHRGGTESFPDIAAMLSALQSRNGIDPGPRDTFERSLMNRIPGTRLVGADAIRLPNTSMAVMPTHGNLKWLTRLDERGFAVSTGSACSAGRGNPSRTMAAMGLDHDEMVRVLRFSSGPATTTGDWMALAAALEQTWNALQNRQRPKTKVDLTNL